MRPTVVSISGLASGVGKTTLLCNLLRRFPGWEAIKISRGHYRSCGKDPKACCVSPLLGEKPLILSGRTDTFAPGKDTGRYWESGASNVQWVVCTSEQIREAVAAAVAAVQSAGVFIEGTSFLMHFPVDLSVMVASVPLGEIKGSAMRVIADANAIFVGGAGSEEALLVELRERLARRGRVIPDKALYSERDLEMLVDRLRSIHLQRLDTQREGSP